MQQIPTRHRTSRSSGKKASAYRAASSRPLPRHPQVRRRRTAVAAGRRRKRRPLLFYVLVVSVAGELAAIAFGMQALVLLFSLTALFLCAVVFRAAKA
jgi:Flp pilus assembly protein TadB